MRCRTTNAAWPSLRCQTAGDSPSARSVEHAAEAEHDLLLQPRLLAAAVEPRRQLAIPRGVLLEVGVEQQQPHAAEPHFPHLHEHRSRAERHEHDARLVVERPRVRDRRVGPVELLVDFLLPAVGRDPLAEVALRIHEADADERHAEVARFLAVIAGEHAEAAGIDRQRLVQRELGAEVRDHLLRVGARVRVPPGPAGRRRRARRIERRNAASYEREKSGVGCRALERRPASMRFSIITGLCARLPPQAVVEPAKHLARRIPGPPEIARELTQTRQTFGQSRSGQSDSYLNFGNWDLGN